ncbi:ABC transporter ATP-binding protein [Plantactinospora veratri]|uniref:ABC transporter ATP-binding protein n=1 Tax=Plantactinospora veratri TaxID=1436122 RepID=A0ABU7S7I6_9ACTN
MSNLELTGVSRWYGNVVAVNDVSMNLGPGVTGLLGPNGAGKTTVLHMMAGFLAPSKGTVTLDGEPTWKNPEVYRRLGLVTERESVYDFLSAYEFALASARLHRMAEPEAAARRAIELVELTDAQDRRIGTYSKGMRQRARVAAALVHDPQVLLLDEPFNGMDPRQRLHMMELLHSLGGQGRTILFSSHILEEVEQVSGTVQVIVSGRLAASGDFRTIRRLMTNRPHVFAVQSSDDRRLAVELIGQPSVTGVDLNRDGLTVRAGDYGSFTRALPKIALASGIRIRRLLPSDESLESVFSYLVEA